MNSKEIFTKSIIESKGKIFLILALIISIASSFATIASQYELKSIAEGVNIKESILLIIILLSASKLLSELRYWVYSTWEEIFINKVYSKFNRNIERLDSSYVESIKPGKINSILSQSVMGAKVFIFDIVFFVLPIFLDLIIFYTLSSSQIPAMIANTVVLGITTYLLSVIYFGNKIREYQMKTRTCYNDLNSSYIESFSSWSTAKSLSLTELAIYKIENSSKKYTKSLLKFYKARSVYGVIQSIPMIFVISLSNGILLHDADFSTERAGIFLTLNAFLIYIFKSLESFNVIYRNIVRSWSDMIAFDEIKPSIKKSQHRRSIEKNKIIIKDKGNNISYSIKRGSRTRISGDSGVGKSTLAQAISENKDTDRWEVSIFDSESYSPEKEASVLYMSSNMRPISTLSPNEHFKNHNSTHTTDLNFEFSHPILGYKDTSHLSQGEQQVLLTLSAINRFPEVLIIDESTSSMDTTLERTILDLVPIGTTLFFISHRDSKPISFDNEIKVTKESPLENDSLVLT